MLSTEVGCAIMARGYCALQGLQRAGARSLVIAFKYS